MLGDVLPSTFYVSRSLSFRFKTSSRKNHRADVVVCGGGIAGTSAAYHLARRGKRVCLFERDSVGCGGATGVSAGLVTAPIFWQDPTNQYLTESSIKLYTELAEKGRFKLNKCGRVYLASSLPNEILLRRMYSRG